MINLSVLLSTKNKTNAPESKCMTAILLISVILLSSCATTHSVTLGEMRVYGANEIWIYEPVRK
tara:strand:+ start:56 stop:247 length:192 start_codon:yes stop_codon:yes gene_type:complete